MVEMIMLVGLPGSGKSSWADEFVKNNPDYKIHSSDKLRKEMLGDINDQSKNAEVFEELHRRIIEDLKSGVSVIYEATNLSKKRRVKFLKTIPKCFKRCVLFLTLTETCIKNSRKREHKVPKEVILEMRKNFCPPYFHEGFDVINTVQREKIDFISLLDATKGFNQENSHHSLDLYGHLKKTWDLALTEDENLGLAAAFHDIGKLYTKSRTNCKGEKDGECHYYNHNNVGAYEFLTAMPTGMEDALYIANLIYYHMHPYTAWKESEKAKNKDKALLGEKMFTDILKLHEFDEAAH